MTKLRHILLTIAVLGLQLLLSGCEKLAILNPKGVIAAQEKHLLVTAVLLMLIVVIPVIILAFAFAWRYRSSNQNAKYTPEWAHSTILEVIWWTIPVIIIAILAVITWISSHQLDPYRPLDSKIKPITIQAVALDWKWLFIYPDQHIASVNFVQIPVNVPVKFLITADAPMNSLEIPQLAGQIYAMAGMQTKLYLMANEAGNYRGLSTNYSGIGFSDMHFMVRAGTQKEFDAWVKKLQNSSEKLTLEEYNKIAKPSINSPVVYYSDVKDGLFNSIIMKYMMPSNAQNMKMDHEMKMNHDDMGTMHMQPADEGK